MSRTLFQILVFVIINTSISTNLNAQFNWAKVGVDGLTCSQCSRSVEMSLRKLDFVQDVEMNLEHTEGRITFKLGAKVNMDKIAQAVVDAGFSVRFLEAAFQFDNLLVNKGYCFAYEEKQYQFVKTDSKTLNGETTLKFIGKNFQPAKEFKHWKSELKPSCEKSKGEIFYVIL